MTSRVLVASYVAVLVLQLPIAYVVDTTTGAVGGLLITFPLVANSVLDKGTTDKPPIAAVWSLGVVFYLLTFSVFAVPTHVLTRKHRRAHLAAMAAVVAAFTLSIACLLPMRSLDL